METKLVLASTSPYRRALLERLGLAFATDAPDVDETRLAGEAAERLVTRLAEAKARAVAPRHAAALVIGSDQVACRDGQILGKPGNRERALDQLRGSAGKTVVFHTGLCLLNTACDRAQVTCEPYRVTFRALSDEQIARYIDKERPYNCAGSFKSEGLGISLFERMEGEDPNALIGLPLIRLIHMLANEGVELP